MRGICSNHPLLPHASLLHNAPFCEVVASLFAKATLDVVHRLRALPGLQNRRYAKWPPLVSVAQPSALPGRWRALRATVCAHLWLWWHPGIN